MFSPELAESYLEQIRRVRDTLDEIEGTFLDNPEVQISIYHDFEKKVINAARFYNDKFVEAFSKYNFNGMKKLQANIIEEIIEISKTITT